MGHENPEEFWYKINFLGSAFDYYSSEGFVRERLRENAHRREATFIAGDASLWKSWKCWRSSARWELKWVMSGSSWRSWRSHSLRNFCNKLPHSEIFSRHLLKFTYIDIKFIWLRSDFLSSRVFEFFQWWPESEGRFRLNIERHKKSKIFKAKIIKNLWASGFVLTLIWNEYFWAFNWVFLRIFGFLLNFFRFFTFLFKTAFG